MSVGAVYVVEVRPLVPGDKAGERVMLLGVPSLEVDGLGKGWTFSRRMFDKVEYSISAADERKFDFRCICCPGSGRSVFMGYSGLISGDWYLCFCMESGGTSKRYFLRFLGASWHVAWSPFWTHRAQGRFSSQSKWAR